MTISPCLWQDPALVSLLVPRTNIVASPWGVPTPGAPAFWLLPQPPFPALEGRLFWASCRLVGRHLANLLNSPKDWERTHTTDTSRSTRQPPRTGVRALAPKSRVTAAPRRPMNRGRGERRGSLTYGEYKPTREEDDRRRVRCPSPHAAQEPKVLYDPLLDNGEALTG